MSLLDKAFKGNIVTTLAIGAGLTLLAPVVIAAAKSVGRPLAKGIIKGGIVMLEKGKAAGTEAGKAAKGIVEEARKAS